MDTIKPLHVFLIITALGIAAYANSFQNEFVWDDDYLILYNTQIQNPSLHNAVDLFRHNLGKHGQDVTNFYRPIQELSYMIDFAIWELDAVGYHLTSLLIHIGAAFVFYLVLMQISNSQPVSLVAAVLYLVHPLHTEAVTYIAGRADSLAALFILLSLYFYVSHRSQETPAERVTFVALSAAAFGIALLSRENALILPVLLLFYEITFIEKESWKSRAARLLPAFILAVTYGVMRLTVLDFGHVTARIPDNVGLYERTLTFFRAFAGYIRLSAMPFELHMERNLIYSRSLLEPRVIVAAVLLAAVIAAAIVTKKRRPLVHFGLGWFLITLFPSSNIPFVLNAPMAEHWMYIPLMGITLAGASVITGAASRLAKKDLSRDVLAYGAAAALAVYFSVLTIMQNRAWRDNETIYTYTLSHAESPRVRYNLGRTYQETGRLLEAKREYEKVLRMDPEFVSAHFNLGLTYGGLGDLDRAIDEFEKTINLDPEHHGAYYALGQAYLFKEMPDRAVELLSRSVELRNDFREAWYALATVHARRGDHGKAEPAFRRLTELDPGSYRAWNMLAECLFQQGKIVEAVKAWEKSLEVNPGQLPIRQRIRQIQQPDPGETQVPRS